MGLDIYAGTLTRYYSHNWKTVVQQWAEENGYAFNRITPDGEPADNEEELSPAEVQAAVENWRDQILNAISQPGQPPYAPWPENNVSPYYTDKPDWDAFGAMLLAAACHTYEEPVPPTVEKDWNFGEHPLVARLAADQERVWSLFRGATWWLPLPDAFFFQAPLPTDDTAAIGTVGGLRKELEKLNQLAWQADEDTILDWADTEGYPADGTVGPDGQYSKADISEHTQYDTQSLAKFAFSMFWRAMRFAEEQQVPILLDYYGGALWDTMSVFTRFRRKKCGNGILPRFPGYSRGRRKRCWPLPHSTEWRTSMRKNIWILCGSVRGQSRMNCLIRATAFILR